jgi:ABC-2 type transport system ATP-binding protein
MASGGGTAELVVSAREVRKRYGGVEALRGASIEVRRGEVFCLLGPNGAGKTTLLEILEGYRGCDGGTVEVLAEDPARAPRAWREKIGIVAQQGAFEPELSVREQVVRYAGYFSRPLGVDEVLDLVDLRRKEDARCNKLSGGEGRRLDIAIGLIGDPELLFLDEPTTGLDPEARRSTWALIEQLRARGTSILLTTHYMEEAEALADRIAMILEGRITAEGTAAEMARRGEGGVRIRFRVDPRAWGTAPDYLSSPATLSGELVEVLDVDEIEYLAQAIEWSRVHGSRLRELEVRRPTLGDVYLELVESGSRPLGEAIR